MRNLSSAARQAQLRDLFAVQPGVAVSELARECGARVTALRRWPALPTEWKSRPPIQTQRP